MLKKDSIDDVMGCVEFPAEWTVFAPFDGAGAAVLGETLRSIPGELTINGKTILAQRVTPTRNQVDFKAFYGQPPYEGAQSAYIFVPLHSDSAQKVTLGMGADWFLQAWLNGEPVFDTLRNGNEFAPPAINNHLVTVRMEKGDNILVVCLMNGRSSAVLALGGPNELRKGDFTSILPPRRVMGADELVQNYPSDPDAPFRWVPPSGFDPNASDVGMPPLKEAEHVELFHALPSKAPVDDGGTGKYESLQHGTWNHVARVAVFGDRLIASWRNHAMDEGGPGTRILARVGRVLNVEGEVDWGGVDDILELAPAPVLVRRRKIHSDRDAVRGTAARGEFNIIDGRLFFCGYLVAKHGVTSDPDFALFEGIIGGGRLIPSGHFHFGKGPASIGAGYVEWDIGLRFYQEWGVNGDRFEPLSPIYLENDPPEILAITPELSLPLEPLCQPYCDAPLLSAAPDDFQELIRNGRRQVFGRTPRYRPGTRRLTHDGINGLAHSSEFRRPDGSWVAVRENKRPSIQPFYYGAEKADEESYYPPARRSNLYGAVNPAAGELPDGRVFIVGNTPNRRSMFVHLSRDGRLFDKTWFLLHRQVKDYTPGAMKREGGPGSGPQYFVSAVVGESLWLVYSISKEHMGATRIPIAALGE